MKVITDSSFKLSQLIEDDQELPSEKKLISLLPIVRKNIRKRRLFKKVQAFCEEKVLRYLLGVFWYAKSKNQCWQAEKWRFTI